MVTRGFKSLHLEERVGDAVDGKVVGEGVNQNTLHGKLGYCTLERQPP